MIWIDFRTDLKENHTVKYNVNLYLMMYSNAFDSIKLQGKKKRNGKLKKS